MGVESAFKTWLEANPQVVDQTNLVAVSGGLDSMTLLHLCVKFGLKVEVSHVNFHLRGSESDQDSKFVEQTCEALSVTCHISNWNDDQGAGSIQMRCRDFRYSEFNRLMADRDLSNTMVAHHSDDSVETFLQNVFRGTGLRGMVGITENRVRILRPLLRCSRVEIQNYADQNKIAFREDSSNAASDYDRNFVRNEVLPLIRQRFPTISTGISKTIENADEAVSFLEDALVDEIEKHLRSMNATEVVIDLDSLRKTNHARFVLFEFLREFGFNSTQVDDMLAAVEPGKTFNSPTHSAVLDRGDLTVTFSKPSTETPPEKFDLTSLPDGFKATVIKRTETWEFNPSEKVAELDSSKLNLEELELRTWKEGDRFKPLGMSGWKKLSDLYIDLKIPRSQKDQIPVLTSENEVVWVVGLRIDDRFKVDDSTTRILQIEYSN